jgi:hypothetical protein
LLFVFRQPGHPAYQNPLALCPRLAAGLPFSETHLPPALANGSLPTVSFLTSPVLVRYLCLPSCLSLWFAGSAYFQTPTFPSAAKEANSMPQDTF